MYEQMLFCFVDDPMEVILGLVEIGLHSVGFEGRLDVTSSDKQSVLRDDFRTAGRNLERDQGAVVYSVLTYDEGMM